MSEQPLSELAKSLMDADSRPQTPMYDRSPMYSHKHHMEDGHCHGWWAFIFYWLLLSIFFYFVYFALRPQFVLKHCDDSHSRRSSDDENRELDNGRLLGAAIVTALVLIFILWLFWWMVSW